jgi:hypothetical protein
MTVRTPIYYDGTDVVEMNTTQINEWKTYIAYLYGTAPSVTVSVVASGGTLSPTMADTRLQAGAYSTAVSAFPSEATTAEPSTVTVNYDKVTGPTYNTSLSATADTNNVAFPAYFDGNDIVAMSAADYVDTFIYATLTGMVSASESASTNGTYTIGTDAQLSDTNLTEIQLGGVRTPVFIDTQALVGAYTAAGIPETLDQPVTVTNYYLFRRSDARVFPSQALLLVDTSGNLNQVDLTSDTSSFNAILKNDIRHYAAEDTAGNKLSYNINGSGNSRGSAMVDTKLDGSGNYQTLQVGLDDYRAQEFPNGSAQTISTFTFKITQV